MCSTSTEGEGDQFLLDAVMQVAFGTAACLVGGGDDAGAEAVSPAIELRVVDGDGELTGDELDCRSATDAFWSTISYGCGRLAGLYVRRTRPDRVAQPGAQLRSMTA